MPCHVPCPDQLRCTPPHAGAYGTTSALTAHPRPYLQTIAVVDANFPAVTISKATVHEKVVPLGGATTPEAIEAIASHLPIDTIDDDGVVLMLPPPGLELPPLGLEVRSLHDPCDLHAISACDRHICVWP